MRHERSYEIIVCEQIGETGPADICLIETSFGSSACEAFEYACDRGSISIQLNGKKALIKENGANKPIFIYDIMFG